MGLFSELRAAQGRPLEMIALLRYCRKASRARAVMKDALTNDDWVFAYDSLCKVSRSFALVIMELEPELRHPVCVFYLVLRALDTIEDDTSQSPTERSELCIRFYKLLTQPDANGKCWSSSEFGDGAERELCRRFDVVQRCFLSLNDGYRRIISDITQRMGAGMAKHIERMECDSVDEYDEYCHYVAGLVGHGLSDIFVESGRENARVAIRKDLANSMGLFLQKTNIIRDYLEDIEEGRTFWPRQIWNLYSGSLDGFKDPANRKFAMGCLNHMVTDALRHVPDCIAYMNQIRTKNVFNFVAIPQVMAIATLTECYGNGKVFEGVVKIRRSLTARLVLKTNNMDDLYKLFFDSAVGMLAKVENHDPNAGATRKLLNEVIDICQPHVPPAPDLIIPNVLSIVAFCGLSSYVLKRRQDHYDGAVFTWRSAGGIMEPLDMLAIAALFIVCIYMFGFFLLPYMTRMQQEEVRRLVSQGEDHAVDDVPRIVTLED